MECSIREKKAVESELSSLNKSFTIEKEKFNHVLEDITTRLRISETEKINLHRLMERLSFIVYVMHNILVTEIVIMSIIRLLLYRMSHTKEIKKKKK